MGKVGSSVRCSARPPALMRAGNVLGEEGQYVFTGQSVPVALLGKFSVPISRSLVQRARLGFIESRLSYVSSYSEEGGVCPSF